MAGEPFVSIVVPVVDSEGLDECVASLRALDYPRHRHEVVIVDARSAAARPVAVEGVCVRGTARNVSAARNLGVEESRGEVVAFTDPDCVATTGWLRRLVEGFADRRVGAVAGSILPFPPRTPAERYMALRRSHSEERALAHPQYRYAMTPNLALRREALLAVGLFDTRFPGGGWEDADLCWRLARHTAYALAHAPRAAVFHRYRSTSRALLVQQYRYGYGLGVISSKYRDELPAEWRRRAGSLSDVLTSVVRLAGPWRGTSVSADPAATPPSPWFDLLRQVGQRGGYWAAMLSQGRDR